MRLDPAATEMDEQCPDEHLTDGDGVPRDWSNPAASKPDNREA